jgi:hypothetical protein
LSVVGYRYGRIGLAMIESESGRDPKCRGTDSTLGYHRIKDPEDVARCKATGYRGLANQQANHYGNSGHTARLDFHKHSVFRPFIVGLEKDKSN